MRGAMQSAELQWAMTSARGARDWSRVSGVWVEEAPACLVPKLCLLELLKLRQS